MFTGSSIRFLALRQGRTQTYISFKEVHFTTLLQPYFKQVFLKRAGDKAYDQKETIRRKNLQAIILTTPFILFTSSGHINLRRLLIKIMENAKTMICISLPSRTLILLLPNIQNEFWKVESLFWLRKTLL